MHCGKVDPRTFIDCAVAQSLRRRVSRSGPTVPVAEAAASVWQPLQPADPVNTTLPAAAVVSELEVDELELDELELDELGALELLDDEDEDELVPGITL
jgi:hypothetical protein